MSRVLAAAAAALLLAGDGSAAPRTWTLFRAGDVTVVGPQAPRTLRALAIQIQQFRAAVGSLIRGAGQPPPMPTIVYAFDDRAAIEPYLPLYQGKPSDLAGYCHCGSSTNPNVIAASLASFAESSAIIFHEYTHVLVRNAAPDVPLWLNEGLAEFYSSFALVDDGRKMELGRPLEHHVRLLRQRRAIAVRDLLRVDASSALYNESSRRSTFYAEAWALTHYLLIERPAGAAAVNRYLAAIGHGRPSEDAYADAFGETPQQTDGMLQAYIRRPSLHSSIVPLAARIDVAEPEAGRALPAVEAEARLAALQLGVQRTAEAAPRIEAAAAGAPDVAEAQLALGLLRVQQERMADAWPPLERAAALAPGDFLTQFTYGLILLRRNVDGGGIESPSTERARTALAQALVANPESAEALAWLAFADLLLDAHLDEAHTAIARAVELAPGRLDFRIREAEVLLRERRSGDAGAILETVAGSTADPAAAHEAASLLDAVRERDRRAAADAPSPADVGTAARHIVLRPVKAGEERAYGDLTSIECGEGGVRFAVNVGARTIVAVAPRLRDVAVISYLDDPAFSPACGPRTPPDVVFLTWRIPSSRPLSQAGIVGEAVALEFVPRDYVP